MWLHAMNVYHKVAKEVGPKREKVAQLTAQLEAANKELQAKRDNLAAVVAKVEQLQKTCDETVAEKRACRTRKPKRPCDCRTRRSSLVGYRRKACAGRRIWGTFAVNASTSSEIHC